MGYNIRFAEKDDTDAIMDFIDKFWRKGHILSRDKVLFTWQYAGNDNKLNIVLGTGEQGDIQGMLGFVPYDDTDNKDISLALWKANPSTGFLGVKLIKYLMDNEPYRGIICPGINPGTTSKIYEHVGMSFGVMTQWYRLADREKYHIAKVADNSIPQYEKCDPANTLFQIHSIDQLKEVFDLDSDEYRAGIPYKSALYIEHRYFSHPIYKYSMYGWGPDGEKAETVFSVRVQECNGARALRIIDCIGKVENLAYATEALDGLLDELDCEYMDVYETGVKDEYFIRGGWRKVEEGGNVIPDYFSPFEQRKVDIYYSSGSSTAIMFKGDGDQDRPN